MKSVFQYLMVYERLIYRPTTNVLGLVKWDEK